MPKDSKFDVREMASQTSDPVDFLNAQREAACNMVRGSFDTLRRICLSCEDDFPQDLETRAILRHAAFRLCHGLAGIADCDDALSFYNYSSDSVK